ncbi:hypothetical protein QCA50_005135 [Cerrena zonata]|uniref:Uncharacterized protein n=1 Tax=Cerrena zonata TaxID=2478898 RepID=A0AAW0GR81_9APHY
MATEEAPHSTLPYPPIHQDKKFVVLSDWDGTITNHDSNDYLTDHLGYGTEKRRQGNRDILTGKVTFRDAFREMLESVTANGHKFNECAEVLRQSINLDVGFKDFYSYCKQADVPVVIISSGMAPLIRVVLSKLIGDEQAKEIEVVANDADVKEDGSWSIKYRHPTSGFGHDKSQAILPYRRLPSPPTIFFFGDGVSDMSAARHADLLFVKKVPGEDNDLSTFCEREGIPHLLFENFGGALKVVSQVVEGKLTVHDALKLGSV